MLPLSPFPSRALAALNAVAQALLFPAAFALNQLLDLRPITTEGRRRRSCPDVGRRAVLGSVLAVLLVLSLPPAVLGLLLWLPVQATRRQFVYSYRVSAEAAAPWDGRRRRDFTFVTANVCLLPSGVAKFSNLGQTASRAKYLARCLAPDGATDRQPLVGDGGGWGYGGTWRAGKERRGDGGVTVEIPWDPKEGIWATPAEPPMGAPKEGAWTTPAEPSKGSRRDTVIDIPRDGVKDAPWDPKTTDTPRGGVRDTPKDPTMETPTTRTPRVGVRVTPKDKTPRDGDTPRDELRATPLDDDTPWEPIGATPRRRDPPTSPPPPRTRLGSSPQLWERFPPDADFVCLQEVFDPVAEALLCRQLGLRYPHVLHGVGAGGLRAGGLKLLGSGLLVASRYPVAAASFYCYPNGAGEDALAAKGLLCIQVDLGHMSGCRLLGFVSCTHLQAPERDAAIRSEQLRLVLQWVQHFQETHSNHGDVVGFDVLCGDLNFDNCSSAEVCSQQVALFRRYRDPGRLGPRREAPWAMGTLLDYLKIYEEPISSPERMRRTLSDPEGRRRFLAGPLVCSPKRDPKGDPKCDPDPNGDPEGDPEGTEWHGRRVDYVLYRECGTELSTEVSALGFVTALAARSDHLPVALTLSVSPTNVGGPGPTSALPQSATPSCSPKS